MAAAGRPPVAGGGRVTTATCMIFIGLVVKNKEPDVFFEENVDEDGEPTYEERTCIISLVNRMFSGGRQGQLTFNEILAVLDANGEDTTLFFKLFLALPKSPVDGTRVLKLLTRKSFDGMLLMYDHRRESEERNISIYAERVARAVDAAPRNTTATPVSKVVIKRAARAVAALLPNSGSGGRGGSMGGVSSSGGGGSSSSGGGGNGSRSEGEMEMEEGGGEGEEEEERKPVCSAFKTADIESDFMKGKFIAMDAWRLKFAVGTQLRFPMKMKEKTWYDGMPFHAFGQLKANPYVVKWAKGGYGGGDGDDTDDDPLSWRHCAELEHAFTTTLVRMFVVFPLRRL